jgi:hypothetical protein
MIEIRAKAGRMMTKIQKMMIRNDSSLNPDMYH